MSVLPRALGIALFVPVGCAPIREWPARAVRFEASALTDAEKHDAWVSVEHIETEVGAQAEITMKVVAREELKIRLVGARIEVVSEPRLVPSEGADYRVVVSPSPEGRLRFAGAGFEGLRGDDVWVPVPLAVAKVRDPGEFAPHLANGLLRVRDGQLLGISIGHGRAGRRRSPWVVFPWICATILDPETLARRSASCVRRVEGARWVSADSE